jgi:sterol desaturase/sphingolipid hydroxylase (fatty acid hydroxylase superfamily)
MMYVYLLLIPLCIVFVLLASLWAWVWHSIVCHKLSSYLNPVSKTHSIHHNNLEDAAHRDFSWVAAVLFSLALGLFVLYFILTSIFPKRQTFWILLCLSLWITAATIFLFQYYMHYSYHNPSSLLHDYQWFQHMTLDHYLHHVDDTCNYGITNHWMDYIFGTYK